MTTATEIDEPAGVSFDPANLPKVLFARDGGRDLIGLAHRGGLIWSGHAMRKDGDGVPTRIAICLGHAGTATGPGWELSMVAGGVHGIGTAALHSCLPLQGSFTVDFGAAGSTVYGTTATVTVSE